MDTQKITMDLLATGITQQELANMIPCSQSAINAFANGKRGARPTLKIGLRLIELHAELCGPGGGDKESGKPQTPSDDAHRRATDPAPAAGHGGRQPPSPHQILDTVPERAVVTQLPPKEKE